MMPFKIRLVGHFDFAKAAALPDLRGKGDRIGQHEVACATRATPNSSRLAFDRIVL